MRLSVVMPVYNEYKTIREIIEKVMRIDIEKEIIMIDDCSTDGTRGILKEVDSRQSTVDGKDNIKKEPTVDCGPWTVDSKNQIKVIFHEKNMGKGAAIRTGFEQVTGDIVVIQDADMEYDPQDFLSLITPILEGRADVVYGSRFLKLKHITLFWHYLANKSLNFFTNLLYGVHLTDMETCYKMFRSGILKEISLRSDRFNFEPEITAKIIKKGYKIFEVPISYNSRDYSEGKKIGWKDAVSAFWTLIKYRFCD